MRFNVTRNPSELRLPLRHWSQLRGVKGEPGATSSTLSPLLADAKKTTNGLGLHTTLGLALLACAAEATYAAEMTQGSNNFLVAQEPIIRYVASN